MLQESSAKKIEIINSLSEDAHEYVIQCKDYADKFQIFSESIKSDELSASLNRIIDVLNKIIDAIIYHPQQAQHLHKLFDYYLPTMDKVLSAYLHYDKNDVSGDSICKTKKEIEDLMDGAYEAFENYLDLLYQDDTLDISSEVAAMKQVMEMDGLKDGIKN